MRQCFNRNVDILNSVHTAGPEAILTVEAPGTFSTTPLIAPGKCSDPQWDNYKARGTAPGFLIKCHTCAPPPNPEIQPRSATNVRSPPQTSQNLDFQREDFQTNPASNEVVPTNPGS